jgi:DNA replication and repair protein RecF
MQRYEKNLCRQNKTHFCFVFSSLIRTFAPEFADEMILRKLSILNYKNIGEAQLELSPKMNCFIGSNGMGKTNVLDAVYYLSFCRSASNPIDAQVIRHEEPFCMIEGQYQTVGAESQEPMANSELLTISVGMKRGQKKHFKRNKKEYKRLSEHIGLIPLVVVSPADALLIEGGSEERRKLMDMVIAQYDRSYIDALSRYNNALQQRNILLKMEDPAPDTLVLQLWEEQMAEAGEVLYAKRRAFVDELVPLFQEYYQHISSGQERVGLTYVSHCQRGPLLDVIQRDRHKDLAVGYSLHGVHRDDLEFTLDGHLMKREGSQGQNKTYVIALKLAQFDFLKRTGSQTTPLLLLDDIFDKLDAQRVEQIVRLVSSDNFGQIFITDTNRDHLDQILSTSALDYQIFHVQEGNISCRS